MSFVTKISDKNDTELLEDFYLKNGNQTNLNINLKLDQSPDIWDSYSILGNNFDVLAVIDNDKNRIACACVLSQKRCYINGSVYEIGYLSNLKVGYQYRGSLAFARLLRFINEYCKKTDADCWLFSVFSDNMPVNELVKYKRMLLPKIVKFNIYNSYIFKPGSLIFRNIIKKNIELRFATNADIPSIKDFIKKTAEKKDMIPDYSVEDICNGTGLLKDFSIENLALAFNKEKIIGMMGLWDQSAYRSRSVESYSKKYRLLRPVINLAAKITGMPALPTAGNSINYKMICLKMIEDDNPDIFKLLFNMLAQRETKNTLLSVGFDQQHPFNSLFQKKCIKLQNNLYLGYWQQNSGLIKSIRKDQIYIEQGGL